jgi:hypothetical protein
LADDLGAETVESRLTITGDLIAEMHAIGQRFRFRIRNGAVIERSCHPDRSEILSRSETRVLWELSHAELARREHGHLSTDKHGSDVFAVLGRAEVKLSLVMAEQLSHVERNVIAQALDRWGTHAAAQTTPDMSREVRDIIAAIQRKLNV